MTLADEEYQELRDAAASIVRAVGVETGGSNIQFARDRVTGDLRVIEMNPRVSRSSALASKATGYPIAKVAAKLAVGYTLDEIPNDLTGTTPASFEPTLDYVVVKFPRFAFEKFPGADTTLGTQMKSVGEAMGIGRSFLEAFLKTMRSRELDSVAEAPWRGLEDVPEGVHPWFLAELDDDPARSRGRPLPRRPRRRRLAAAQAAGDLRRRRRRRVRVVRGSRARAPARLRRPSRLPPRRLVRRRGRGRFELLLLRLGRAGRGGARPAARVVILGSGPEPDRPGDRVRLLLRPRGALLPRARARGGDGQLQSGDRFDRLRHVRPALLRAARRRRGAGDLRARAAGGSRHPVRRTDAAQARARARACGLPHPRHAVRGDRPGRGP